MAQTSSSNPVAAGAGGIRLWPADVLAGHLRSADPLARTVALGMAVLPGAPIDRCVDALVDCAGRSTGDALASQLAATALGSLPAASASDAVQAALARLAGAEHALPVRVAAAHALFRLACMPAAAQAPLSALLFDPDADARRVALLALRPFAPPAAGAIARHVATTPPASWTVEALQALVASAGEDAASRAKVEAFVMRSLAGAPLLPTGVAGYACLAGLSRGGASLAALVRIASDTAEPQAAVAALEAIGTLGEPAQAAAPGLAQVLAATDEPAREELLCRTLVRVRCTARDVPMARVRQRLENSPERSTAAHCMLLCLHPKDFAPAATLVQRRFAGAGEALRKTLAQTFKTLTGTELTGDALAGKA
jgi:hypothetical protein